MVQSCGNCVSIISLVLISAVALHAGRGHSSDDIYNSSNITVKYAENIRDKLTKRMVLTIDDLFAVHQQLLLHYVSVNSSQEQEQQPGELSKMKRALQNCDFQVNRMQRRDNAKLLCGQLTILLLTV